MPNSLAATGAVGRGHHPRPDLRRAQAKAVRQQARGEDYYNEGSLVWLAADMTIRELSKGSKSLDDFAKAFFGVRDADWGVLTYDFDEVVRTLNAVQPYDWAKFLDTRLRQPGQPAPLTGFEKGGYKLVWKEEPNIFDKERMKEGSNLNLTHSLGLTIDKDGKVTSVFWNSPAFKADIVNGAKIIAVDGIAYTKDGLTDAITAAKDGKTPVRLLVERNKRYEQIDIAYSGGLRYPHLESRRQSETAFRPPAYAAPQIAKKAFSQCVSTLSPPVTIRPKA